MICLLPVLVASGTLLGLIDEGNAQYYASKYDHIDVDAILNNRRIVNYYAACLLSKGPCPPEGIEFKRILPEALRTNCQRCSEKQKTVTLRAIKRLKKEYPKVWAQLEKQWDPSSNYISKFESTFGSTPSESIPQPSVQVLNRFGPSESDNKTVENTISQVFTTPLSTTASTTSTTTTTSATSSKTTAPTKTTTSNPTTVSTKAAPVTKTTTHRVSTLYTIKQNINTISASTKPTKRPRPSIGQSIQATVSLGTNIVGDLVRGLNALGNRVVETGAEIAGVVLKNIARPL